MLQEFLPFVEDKKHIDFPTTFPQDPLSQTWKSARVLHSNINRLRNCYPNLTGHSSSHAVFCSQWFFVLKSVLFRPQAALSDRSISVFLLNKTPYPRRIQCGWQTLCSKPKWVGMLWGLTIVHLWMGLRQEWFMAVFHSPLLPLHIAPICLICSEVDNCWSILGYSGQLHTNTEV